LANSGAESLGLVGRRRDDYLDNGKSLNEFLCDNAMSSSHASRFRGIVMGRGDDGSVSHQGRPRHRYSTQIKKS
jgi:hypothetical protein